MSSQDNWNNPDMYYRQDRPQSGPASYGGADGHQPAYGVTPYDQSYASAPDQSYAGTYGNAVGYRPLPPTNTLAVVGMVASIFGVVSSVFIAGIAGIVMGHIALKQIRTTGERGEGMAKAALWIGYIGTILWVLFWVVYVLFVVVIFGGMFFGAAFSSVG